MLLPSAGTDLEAWAVIACDQYTQDRRYWKRVEERVGAAPSMLRLIFPEIYLEDAAAVGRAGGPEGSVAALRSGRPSRSERIAGIRAAMDDYLSNGTFAAPVEGLLYLERSTAHHECRRGLLLAVDLERYDWAPSARPLIRATEGTVVERLPPRMEIRRGAPLESPHVILLIDDEKESLIEGLGERARERPALYETELMLDAGTLRAWALDRESDWEYLARGLERLAEAAGKRYGTADGEPFLYAVGDGNHSLATAKAIWEEYKEAHRGEGGLMDHPARYALVEVENIYDAGIEFEPIHRLVFGATLDEVSAALSGLPGCATRGVSGTEELDALVSDPSAEKTRYGLIAREGCVLIETDARGISTEPLQPILDRFVAAGAGGRSIDYLHGSDETARVSLEEGAGAPRVGILLPPVGKSDLFATVARSGPLPRKSFSMGEASEKRFYLECRALFR